jgi:hypothetical protein
MLNWSNLERKLSFNDVNRLFEIASGKTGQQVQTVTTLLLRNPQSLTDSGDIMRRAIGTERSVEGIVMYAGHVLFREMSVNSSAKAQ